MATKGKKPKLKRGLFKHYAQYVAVGIATGIVGVSLVRLSGATSDFPASSGGPSGISAEVDAPAQAPTKLQAITGGNSIALLWDMPAYGIKQVEVYRNDVKVATVTPYSGLLRAERLGTRYIDRDVSRGATYHYKVRVTSQTGSTSPFSSTITATQPSNTTAVPSISIDSSQAPDLADYLNTHIEPEIETWYPKISDAIAFPTYTPPTKIQIVVDENNPYIASATGTKITVKPSWLRLNFYDGGGALLHEATHVVQSYPNGSDTSGWITEGIADWTRDWFTRERFYIPRPNEQLGKYSPGGFALAWGDAWYRPGLIRNVNVALHNRTYSTNLIPSQTGRSPQQLFSEAKQAHYGDTGVLMNDDGKCLDIQGNGVAIGTKLQLMPCNSLSGRRWTMIYHDAGLHGNTKKILHFANSAVAADGRCLEVNSYSIQENTVVIPNNCTWFYSQEWVKQDDGSLKSLYSNKCLAPLNNSWADGTPVVIATCSGTGAQRWTLAPWLL